MRLTERLLALVVVASSTPTMLAALPAELADLAARIDYGFYTEEPRVVEAAAAALERLGRSPDVDYYRDLAALRLAQLGAARGSGLEACSSRAPGNDARPSAAVEAWILAAACSAVRGSTRRAQNALQAARGLDDDHPRLALVEAWELRRAAGADLERLAAVAERLEAAIARFDAWTPRTESPEWGHAEALAALGEIALLRGEVRRARDLAERALLIAPDYRFAEELRTRVVRSAAP